MEMSPRLGTGPFFGEQTYLANKRLAENMDLSPFRNQGGQSHFRGDQARLHGNVRHAAKIGTAPCERLPIVAALQAVLYNRTRSTSADCAKTNQRRET